jgi:hypothetical protein
VTKWAKLLLLAVLYLFLPEFASAQGSFFTGIAWRYTPAGAFPASGASVDVCTSAGSGAPCTPHISLFADVALASPVSNPLPVCTTSPQFGCIDGLGNFSFYASTTGPYTYTITGAGLTAYGPIPISASLNPAANIAFLGNITVAGTAGLNGGGNFAGTFTGNPTLSGNPSFSGNPAFSGGGSTGTLTAGGGLTGNPNTWTATQIFTNLGNVLYQDAANTQARTGAQMGAWLNSAIGALPTNAFTGKTGVIVASTATPTTDITVSSDPFSGRTNNDRLQLVLPAGNLATSVAWNPVENTDLGGHGERTSTITVTANSIYAIQSLNSGAGIQQLMIHDMTINGGLNVTSTTGTGCIHEQRVFQPSVIYHVNCQGVNGTGILVENFGINGGAIEYSAIACDETAATNPGTGLALDSTADFAISFVTSEFCNIGYQIRNTGINHVKLTKGRYEIKTGTTALYALDISNSAGVSVDGLQIANAGTLTCGININNGAQGLVLKDILFLGAGTYSTGKVCIGGVSVGFTGTYIGEWFPAGGLIIGNGTSSGASAISSIIPGSATLTYTAISASTCQEQTLTVTGATSGKPAFFSPVGNLGNVNLSWSSYVSGANTVSVRVCNPTGGSLTPSASTWNGWVMQ